MLQLQASYEAYPWRYYFRKGFKIADIDPRESEITNCFTISDKARSIAGSVLEAVSAFEHGVKIY